MGDFFSVIIDLFKLILGIPVKFPQIFDMLYEFGVGIFTGAWGLFESVGIGTWDVARLAYHTFIFAMKYLSCAIQLMFKFKSCFFVHVIGLIKMLAYVALIWAPCMAIAMLTGYDFLGYVDYVLELIDDVDTKQSEFSGVLLTRPSDSLTRKCYTCNGKILKSKDVFDDMDEFIQLGMEIRNDFVGKIPKKLKPLVTHWGEAYNSMMDVFTPIF